MLSCGSTTGHKRKWNRKFMTHRSWRKCIACPQGLHGEVKAEFRESWSSTLSVDRDRQDHGHIPLLGSMGGVLWVSQARPRFVHSNQKNRILVNLTKVLPKRCIEQKDAHTPGRQLIISALGEVLSKTYICLLFCRLTTRMCVCMRGLVFKVSAGHFAKQNRHQGSNIME